MEPLVLPECAGTYKTKILAVDSTLSRETFSSWEANFVKFSVRKRQLKKSLRYDVMCKHIFARAIMNQLIIAAFASVVLLLLAVVIFAGVIVCV